MRPSPRPRPPCPRPAGRRRTRHRRRQHRRRHPRRRSRQISRTSLRRRPTATRRPKATRRQNRHPARPSSGSSNDRKGLSDAGSPNRPQRPASGQPPARDRDRAADRRRDGAAGRTARARRFLRGQPVQRPEPERRPGELGAYEQPLPRPLGMRDVRRPRRLSRRGRVRALGLQGLGLARRRAPSSPACRRTQASPTRRATAGSSSSPAPGAPWSGSGPSTRTSAFTRSTASSPSFSSWLRCVAPGAGRPCGRAGSESSHAYVRGVFLRLEDRAAPTVELSGGSLLDPVVRGVRELAFMVADAGGGVRKSISRRTARRSATTSATARSPTGSRPRSAPARQAAPPRPRCRPPTRPSPPARTWSMRAPRTWRSTERCSAPVAALRSGSTTPVPAPPCRRPGSAPASRAARPPPCARIGPRSCGRVTGRSGPVAGATVCALTRIRIAGAPIVVAALAASGPDGRYQLELAPGPGARRVRSHAVGDRVIARHGLGLRSIVRPTLAVDPGEAQGATGSASAGGSPGRSAPIAWSRSSADRPATLAGVPHRSHGCRLRLRGPTGCARRAARSAIGSRRWSRSRPAIRTVGHHRQSRSGIERPERG